jgi:hypothetical protein
MFGNMSHSFLMSNKKAMILHDHGEVETKNKSNDEEMLSLDDVSDNVECTDELFVIR